MMDTAQHRSLMFSELLAGLAVVDPAQDREITGLSLDSRAVQRGDCFIALNGANRHGSEFADQALAAGANAILVEDIEIVVCGTVPVVQVQNLSGKLGSLVSRYFDHPSARLDVIAVTGTNGKTTVALLCAYALRELRGSAAYVGTLGFGLVDDLRATVNTTPDAVTLHEFFAELCEGDCSAVTLEVSSHAIAQSRVLGTAIDVAVFTNLGHDHLDYHSTREAYARVKKSLFHYDGIKHAVINVDDDVGLSLVAELKTALTCWTYSCDLGSDTIIGGSHISLIGYTPRRDGCTLRMRGPQGESEFNTPLIGDFNAQNLMASLATLMALGIDQNIAVDALARVACVPGRMQRVKSTRSNDPMVIVDYAHTPDSLHCVLRALRDVTPGRLVCVFGCGGDRDSSKRAPMGMAAERDADLVIITSDNPRSEDNASIASQISSGMSRAADALIIHDRKRAIRHAIELAAPGDTVLIAGKGHEQTQEIAGTKSPFVDADLAAAILREARP